MLIGGSQPYSPAAQLFAECAQVGSGVELGDQKFGGFPSETLKTAFTKCTYKLHQINDSSLRVLLSYLVKRGFKRLKIQRNFILYHHNV